MMLSRSQRRRGRGPTKSSQAYQSPSVYVAARNLKQPAISDIPRPSLKEIKYPPLYPPLRGTRAYRPGQFENRDGYRDNIKSNSFWPRVEYHVDSGQDRGRHLEPAQEQRFRRPSSRSLSPNARDRYDAYDRSRTHWDYEGPVEEDSGFNPYRPTNSGYYNRKSDEVGEWEDEYKLLYELDGPNAYHDKSQERRAELAYLKRMLTKFRNRKKKLLLKKPDSRVYESSRFNHNDSSKGYGEHYRSENNSMNRLMLPPPSRSCASGRSQSRPAYASTIRSFQSYDFASRHEPRSGWDINHDERRRRTGFAYRAYSSSFILTGSNATEVRSGCQQRSFSSTSTSRLAPISNDLKFATNTQNYPARTVGHALHIDRWLSDRYTGQVRYDFGELPRSEGIKKHYIQDPNDPNKFLNVPRPGRALPGARGDYYRGAAWRTYTAQKTSWLKYKGCHYPDSWINKDSVFNRNQGTRSDARVKEIAPKGLQKSRINQSQDYRDRTYEDLASEISHEDLISIAASDDTDGMPRFTVADRAVDDILNGIKNANIDYSLPIRIRAPQPSMSRFTHNSPLREKCPVPAADQYKTQKSIIPPTSLIVFDDPDISGVSTVAPPTFSKPERSYITDLLESELSKTAPVSIQRQFPQSLLDQ